MWAVSRLLPAGHFVLPGRLWLSAAVFGVGACVAILGVLEFRAAGTTVDPRTPDQSENLVVNGIYRYSRNPMYLGFFLLLVAWGIFLGSVFSWLLLPLFVIYMNRFQILPEERHMRVLFGDVYERYMSQVRRWL
nr:isoprenylcysteine carboxylmethyltransferase family protein [Marinobacter sp. C7]